MIDHIRCFLALSLIGLLSSAVVADELSKPTTATPYAPDKSLTGQIRLVGSHTMQQVAVLWKLGFQRLHPDAHLEIYCGGSETALEELTKPGNVIGLTSRGVQAEDLRKLNAETGKHGVAIVVGQDLLAVVVHPDNPCIGLPWNEQSVPKLLAGEEGLAKSWGELGVADGFEKQPLTIYAPEPRHGKFQFLERLLADNNGKTPDLPLDSHQEILSAVANDPGGLGFWSATRGQPAALKVLPVISSNGQSVIAFEDAAIERGYPLLRPLNLIVTKIGLDSGLDPLVEEFVKYVLSRDGQLDLIKDGFLPLTSEQLHLQENKLGWEILK